MIPHHESRRFPGFQQNSPVGCLSAWGGLGPIRLPCEPGTDHVLSEDMWEHVRGCFAKSLEPQPYPAEESPNRQDFR